MKRKVLALVMAAAMVASMAGCGDKAPASTTTSSTTTESSAAQSSTEASTEATAEIVKPASIRAVVDGTVITPENGQEAFEKQLEEKLGLDVVFDSQDHSGYTDAVSRVFASGDLPDVIILNAAQYAAYAKTGVLWDMTEAYENAEFQSRLVSTVNEGLKIDGAMYGIALTRGNGCVTYVKQAWLDAVGIEAPKTYDEYYNMLKLFTENDPDGNGKKDTYGVGAAGIVAVDAPYTNYLPEFWQDSYPDFMQDANGAWIDGFDTDATKGALTRLQDAYQAGYIDPETLTQGTKEARNKYFAEGFGAFSYWAGTWQDNIMKSLKANNLPTDLAVLAPIAELGSYIERQSAVWAITTACENPEGVFKYFIEPMLDGGDVEFLWTYGAEGTHWSRAAETITYGDTSTTYEEGQFHMLPSPEKPDTPVSKNHLDTALVIAPLDDDHKEAPVIEVVDECNRFFIANSTLAPYLPSSDVLNDYNGDLWDIKNKVITEVVVNGNDVETWMQYYRDNAGEMAAEVLEDLNK